MNQNNNNHTRSSSGTFLSEEYIQNAFHSYLKSSLTQAKIERLLDADVLSSAEGDLMITGPALCLYFAALRCTTNPPSVPLPRQRKDSSSPSPPHAPTDLSAENCPPNFRAFLSVWATCVPKIQALSPEHQHDLARIICGLDQLTVTMPEEVYGIAADLRAVAIEISQRRSFQDRYAADLQAALDSSTPYSTSMGPSSSSTTNTSNGTSSPGLKVKASFVPPPSYEESSPTSSAYSSAHSSPNHQTIHLPQGNLPPQDSAHLSPFSPSFEAQQAPPLQPRVNRHSVGSIASTATSVTLQDEPEPPLNSPPFPIPQIPIGHGTYYPPHVPPPVPPKAYDDGGGEGGGGYNITKPLKLSKKDHRRTQSATSTTSSSHRHPSFSSTTTSPSRPSFSSTSASTSNPNRSPTPTSPSLITPTTPSIDIIRETLYASLADVLSSHASLRAMLKLDPPRAYFGAVALAVLDVATNAVSVSVGTGSGSGGLDLHSGQGGVEQEDGGGGGDGGVTVHGILGTSLTLSSCPPELKPFMKELGEVARGVKRMREEDDERAVRAMTEAFQRGGNDGEGEGEVVLPEPRLDVVKRVLEEGVGGMRRVESLSHSHSSSSSSNPSSSSSTNHTNPGETRRDTRKRHRRTPSPSNRTLTFCNRINALALGMVGLKAFRERQGEVFRVLAAAGSSA